MTLSPAAIASPSVTHSALALRSYLLGGPGESRLEKQVLAGCRHPGDLLRWQIRIALGEGYASKRTLFHDSHGPHMIELKALLDRCFQYAALSETMHVTLIQEAAEELWDTYTCLILYLDRAKAVSIFGGVPLAKERSIRERGYEWIGFEVEGEDPLDRFYAAIEAFIIAATGLCDVGIGVEDGKDA